MAMRAVCDTIPSGLISGRDPYEPRRGPETWSICLADLQHARGDLCESIEEDEHWWHGRRGLTQMKDQWSSSRFSVICVPLPRVKRWTLMKLKKRMVTDQC